MLVRYFKEFNENIWGSNMMLFLSNYEGVYYVLCKGIYSNEGMCLNLSSPMFEMRLCPIDKSYVLKLIMIFFFQMKVKYTPLQKRAKGKILKVFFV